MHLVMFPQGTLQGKRLATLIAGVRLLPRVSFEVLHQVTFERECALTLWTLVGPLTRVCPHVLVQVALLEEQFIAL